MKLPLLSLVEVIWYDIVTSAEWVKAKDAGSITPAKCKTTGYYMGCKRKGKQVLWIIVAHSYDPATGDFDYTVIPYGPLVKIEKIE